MDFDLTKDEIAFRDEVRQFLDDNLKQKTDNEFGVSFDADWNKKVREKRWVGFGWPKEVGGGGGTIMEQVILKEEMATRKAPALGTCFMGLAWVGPSIIEYGTEEQKKRFIPDILDGKYQWCTGYSEPNYGSDLASLQCKGVLEGDEYVVNGQKIWTSLAPFAAWMILLVRTDFDTQSKHEGITCLLVDFLRKYFSPMSEYLWKTALGKKVKAGRSLCLHSQTSAQVSLRYPPYNAVLNL